MKYRHTLLLFLPILCFLPSVGGFSTPINQIIVELALNKNTRPTAPLQPAPRSKTPLLEASQKGNAKAVALLLSHGAWQHHQAACIYAIYNAVSTYATQLVDWRIHSPSLEELCKRGAYVTQEQFEQAQQNTPVLKKHPKALNRLLQQYAPLIRSRVTVKHTVLRQYNMPQDLIRMIDKFEVGPDANYNFLLSCAEK